MILKFFKTGYDRLRSALSKTRLYLGQKLRSLFSGSFDSETFDKLEETLYEADVGVETAAHLTQRIRDSLQKQPSLTSEQLMEILKQELMALLPPSMESRAVLTSTQSPLVILVVGVNGSGKTTTVAKLAQWYLGQGKKVLLGATDTFRAAAAEQLALWAERLGIEAVRGVHKADPAAVAFDAVTAAKARGIDVVLIDTAGRLQTKTPLMQELEKVRRSCNKVIPGAPHETLLVLDATTGQNAVDQARIFNTYTPVSGLVLTKLDGTAKGGIAIAIQHQFKIPIKFIGTGETLEDLSPFDSESFVSALLES